MSIIELKEKIKQQLISFEDEVVLEKFLDRLEHQGGDNEKVRLRGSGKHIFGEMSDDFNEPLEDFADYM